MPGRDTYRKPLRVGECEFAWGRKTYVMGVLNVTPDSFSGDGIGADVRAAVDRALRFQEQGADIIDVGGESTRPRSVYPDARPVPRHEEADRVLPVVEELARELSVPISIDTMKADVIRQAVNIGAAMANDVSMLRADPEMAPTVAELGVPLVINHNRDRAEYEDVMFEVIGDLQAAADRAVAAGVRKDRIILDPGIGFGKTAAQSLEVQRRLAEMTESGFPILVGTSRKSSIGAVLDLPADQRVEGTAATVALAIAYGADIVRVHDVREMARVARMSDAIVRGWPPPA